MRLKPESKLNMNTLKPSLNTLQQGILCIELLIQNSEETKTKKNYSIHDAICRHMTEPTLLQFAVSSCPPTDWLPINVESHSLIALVHFALASNKIGVEEAGKLFSGLLSSHLQHHDIICSPKQGEHRSSIASQ